MQVVEVNGTPTGIGGGGGAGPSRHLGSPGAGGTGRQVVIGGAPNGDGAGTG